MPIYEVDTNRRQIVVKRDSTTPLSPSGGGAGREMSFIEMTEADREQEFSWTGQQPSVTTRSASFQLSTSTPLNDRFQSSAGVNETVAVF